MTNRIILRYNDADIDELVLPLSDCKEFIFAPFIFIKIF
jgi:hypothetical protein